MAVRIRLMRMGSKRRPFYRFVVADSRGKRDGGFLDQVGTYNPIAVPHEIKVDEEKIFDWLSKGAGLSDGARSLLKKNGTLSRWDIKRGKSVGAKAEEVAGEAREEVTEEVTEEQEKPVQPVEPESLAGQEEPEAPEAPSSA
jgi:small subunit ribosomal protein S16